MSTIAKTLLIVSILVVVYVFYNIQSVTYNKQDSLDILIENRANKLQEVHNKAESFQLAVIEYEKAVTNIDMYMGIYE